MMPIDVPAQVVEGPAVENHVYVIPGVNWDLSRHKLADKIELKDDPDNFYSLEMVDAPEFEPVTAAKATASAGADDGRSSAHGKHASHGKQVSHGKRKQLLLKKHSPRHASHTGATHSAHGSGEAKGSRKCE